MRIVYLRFTCERSDVLRHSFARALRGNGQDRSEVGNLFGRRRLQVRGNRKLIVEAARIQDRDLQSLARSFTDSMGENGDFATQVGSDDQQRAQRVDRCDAHPEVRVNRVGGLITQVVLSQSVVDIARAQSTRDATGEI